MGERQKRQARSCLYCDKVVGALLKMKNCVSSGGMPMQITRLLTRYIAFPAAANSCNPCSLFCLDVASQSRGTRRL